MKIDKFYRNLALVILLMCALFGGIWFIATMPYRNALGLCDDAIKDQLKAPATYRRVGTSNYSNKSFRIEYDAQNSFGVPLRGKGYCSVDPNREAATWTEI